MSDPTQPPADPTPQTPGVPAGWYKRPDTGATGYWDGSQWTNAQPPAERLIAPLAIAALIAGAGAFLFGLIPVFGLILALGGLALGIFAIIRRQNPIWMPLAGLGGSAIAGLTGIIVLAGIIGGGGNTTSQPAADTPTPTVTPTEVVKMAEVPNVIGMTVADATAALQAVGLQSAVSGAGDDLVTATRPGAGTSAEIGSTVTVTSQPSIASFAETDDRTYAQIAKDPDAYVGTKLIIYGSVTQFDSATGPCTMRVNTSNFAREYSYDYDVNTIVTSGDGSTCPVLNPIVQDDHVKMWGVISGSLTYDTAIGGSATAVLVDIVQIELLAPQEY